MIRIATLAILSAVMASVTPGADAAPIKFVATLDGPSEFPPVASPGTGYAVVDFDIEAHTLRVVAFFENLIGNVTTAHIHGLTAVPGAGVAGVATTTPTFPGFPAGVTSGEYSNTFDTTLASSFNPAFVTAQGGTVAEAEAALFSGMLAGRTYFNIHTTAFGGGEIRGFLVVPEPSTIAVLALGLAGIGFAAWRGRRAPAQRA